MNFRTILFAILIFTTSSFAQTCEQMIPFIDGATVAYKSYDKKEKLTGTSRTSYSKVTTSGSTVSSKASSEFFDKDGKSVNKAEYTLICDDGVFKVDMSMMMPSSSTEAFKGMQMEMEGDNIVYPSSLSVGDDLPLGKMKVTVTNSGMSFATIEMEYTERKVESKEELVTPAGTFTCYKISESYSSATTMSMMPIPINVTGRSVNWYNAEVGNVKTESYDKKDKLLGVTVLEEIKK